MTTPGSNGVAVDGTAMTIRADCLPSSSLLQRGH